MVRKGWGYDAFKYLHGDQFWIEARDRMGSLIDSWKTPPGSDPRVELAGAVVKFGSDGWRLEDFSSKAISFYCNKGDRRLCVQVTAIDPTKPRQLVPIR